MLASIASAAQQSPVDARVSALPDSILLGGDPGSLVDAGRQQAAHTLAVLVRPAWFVSAFLSIAVLIWLWRSGRGAAVRDRLRATGMPLFFVRALFGAFLVLVVQLATLLPAFYDYRVLRIMQLSTERFPNWLGDLVISTLLAMVVVGLAAAVILWLVDRTHAWWIYVIAGAFVMSFFLSFIYPIAVEPLFNTFRPLSNGHSLSVRIHELARRAGEGDLPIYVSDLSRRSRAGNAYVVGIGPSKRIVIGDTLLGTATDREVLFVVGHELGHDVHRDTFKGALFGALLFILGAALAVLAADRVGFRRDDDPLSRLALVGAFLIVVNIVFMPMYNGYSRVIEANADAYGLQLTHDRAAGARAMVRFTDEDLALLCPGRLARLWWYTHPPSGTRIAFMNGRQNPCP